MKIGERVRNSVRGREAMAKVSGGAALTRVFVMKKKKNKNIKKRKRKKKKTGEREESWFFFFSLFKKIEPPPLFGQKYRKMLRTKCNECERIQEIRA